MRRLQGFTLVIAATAISGLAGYLVTFIVYRVAGQADYAAFAVFWAALYLVVGGLSGVQQEIARATHRVEPSPTRGPSAARGFALVLAALVLLAVLATSPLWAGAVFGSSSGWLVLPLAAGTASYVLVAVLCGSLYGVARWESLALMIAADGVLRLLLVAVGVLFTRDIVALAWFVALPFPLAIGLLWFVIRRGFVGTSQLDVGHRALSANVARTVLASVSTAVLVSGFPLLLGVTAQGQSAAFVGELIFTITLARAPLIITVMSLQSYFVVRFRDDATRWVRQLLRIEALILGATAVVALLGWGLGPWAFALVSGRQPVIDGALIAVLVASSGLVAVLSVAGSAVLARASHLAYSAGWLVAAIVTVAVMITPLEFVPRVAFALLAGPVAGLVVYGAWMIRQRSTEAA